LATPRYSAYELCCCTGDAGNLRHCTVCKVYFEHPEQEQRHVNFHTERTRNSTELARLARLDVLDAEDRAVVQDAEQRIFERDIERRDLRARVETLGLVPSIAGP
jgi:hypothetical protein